METHSSPSETPDSTKPGTKAESFALLESEASLQRFVEEWKAGRLPKAEWTHAAHVAMAAYFAFDHAAAATFASDRAASSPAIIPNTPAGASAPP